MAGSDWTTLLVAVTGVGGTIGASWLGQRELRQQAREQMQRELRTQSEQHSERVWREQRQLYVALNSALRDYRLALLYAARSAALGEPISEEQWSDVERARSASGTQYARAQMMLPLRLLQVATETTRCLAVGYQLLTRVDLAGNKKHTAQTALDWVRDTVTEVSGLLRTALREDLGVDPPIGVLDQQLAKFASLRAPYETESDAVCPPSGAGAYDDSEDEAEAA